MTQIIPKVDAAALASVAALAGDNIITEDELSLSRSGTQGGFSFDGSNDYLEGPTDDFGTSDFSLVFDILWDDAPSGSESFQSKDGNNRIGFSVNTTYYRLSFVNGAGSVTHYDWSITPSVNHRSVIVTADRSGNATLYLNGESQGTQAISAQSAVDLGSGNTNPQRIGYTSNTFDGKMFQVRYYNTLKTAGQVLNLAKGHNDTDSLWLHLSPTSTEDNLWVDISGNQRTFVNNGATRIESRISKSFVSESEYVSSKIGRQGGFSFDGVNDFFEFYYNAILNNHSWAFEFKTSSDVTTTQYLLYGNDGGNNNRAGLYITSGTFRIRVGDAITDTNVMASANKKYSVVLVADAGVSLLYLNGGLVFTGSYTVPVVSGTAVSWLGQASGNSDYWTGDIYSFRIWSAVKTAVEARAIAKGYNDTTNLELHLSGDTVSSGDTVWADVSGNDRNAVNNGATAIASPIAESHISNQELVSSRVGRGGAYYFDGGDYVKSTLSNGIPQSSSIVISFDGTDITTTQYLFQFLSGANDRFYGFIASSQLRVTHNDSSTLATNALTTGNNVAVFVKDDTNAKIYLNGVLVAQEAVGAFTSTASGTLNIGYDGSGNNYTGEIDELRFFNRALTAAEVELVSRGQSLGFADEGADGSATYTSDFSSDSVDSFSAGAGDATLDATETIGGDSDNLKVEYTTGANFKHIERSGTGLVSNKKFRCTLDYYIDSSNTAVDGFQVRVGTTTDSGLNVVSGTTDAWSTVTFETTCGDANTVFYIYALDGTGLTPNPGASDYIAFRNITLTQLGEVVKLLPESAASAKWYNEGGAGSSADGTVTGATLINERKRGVYDSLNLQNIPTSSAGLATGEIWSNSGVLTIV